MERDFKGDRTKTTHCYSNQRNSLLKFTSLAASFGPTVHILSELLAAAAELVTLLEYCDQWRSNELETGTDSYVIPSPVKGVDAYFKKYIVIKYIAKFI